MQLWTACDGMKGGFEDRVNGERGVWQSSLTPWRDPLRRVLTS